MCECVCVFECVFLCVFMSSIRSVRYRTEKTKDAGNSPVPDQAKARQSGIFWVRYRTEIIDAGNADAGISFLDANAQLWVRHTQ
jgi:hypothetical protein